MLPRRWSNAEHASTLSQLRPGLGRLDLVRDMLSDEGSARDGVALVDIPGLRFGNDPKANFELAAVWARIHGHPEIESYLVERDVDAEARNNWGKPMGS